MRMEKEVSGMESGIILETVPNAWESVTANTGGSLRLLNAVSTAFSLTVMQ